jgi:hypothetical protein
LREKLNGNSPTQFALSPLIHGDPCVEKKGAASSGNAALLFSSFGDRVAGATSSTLSQKQQGAASL